MEELGNERGRTNFKKRREHPKKVGIKHKCVERRRE